MIVVFCGDGPFKNVISGADKGKDAKGDPGTIVTETSQTNALVRVPPLHDTCALLAVVRVVLCR